MRVALLTTETTHHAYFASRLREQLPLDAVIVETRAVTPAFDTFHPYEDLRDEYERDVLLGGHPTRLAQLAQTFVTDSVNDQACVTALRRLAPDIVIVFGTGRCGPAVIGAARVACLNLHGGNPEQYRGLDTHLWAIYHNDFDNLTTTLHFVDDDLDTGDVVMQAQLPLTPGLGLHELRALNTRICVDLASAALAAVRASITLPRRRQITRGRYYSFMPAVLKDTCVRNFARHVSTR